MEFQFFVQTGMHTCSCSFTNNVQFNFRLWDTVKSIFPMFGFQLEDKIYPLLTGLVTFTMQQNEVGGGVRRMSHCSVLYWS